MRESWLLRTNMALVAVGLAACSAGQATPAAPAPTHTPRPTAPPTLTPTVRPTASAAPTQTTRPCRTAQGSLEQLEYPSALLGRRVPIRVYRPACASPTLSELPVIYFLHGKPFDEEHWLSLGTIAAYESGWARGRWGPAVLVFPRAMEPLFSSSDGGEGSYEQEFLQSLMPYLEREHDIGGRTALRGLAGISRGGIWALEIGLRHPRMFRTLAALSPSLAVNYPRKAYDPFELAATTSEYPQAIFLLAGEDDWALIETERLYRMLAEGEANVELEVVPGSHVDGTWSQALPTVLNSLVGPLKDE